MTDSFDPPYPNYDILRKWDSPSYNQITRDVLTERLTAVPQRQFLDEQEWRLLQAICDQLVPQPERTDPVPITPFIDAALTENRTNGTRFAGIPAMREAWRKGLAAIRAEAMAQHDTDFVSLDAHRQEALLHRINDGDAEPAHWDGMPAQRFFRSVLLKEVLAIYYAHPAAQSEIGFGGPAAPRGYVRMGADRMDPWEAPADRRNR
ncbi:gluconate 2-dehydrogenase subunit 3 family protein [Loktanella sp. SALINAS62]|uniref:gluconate 2-dehydrogenase subunit 3 family protein n=1 Tax=Loktanella sp. SALINAS62 TaxID=2706124 RepID=UPI001B8B43BA|nr:gluconate 2-dehydrogenase subunit 3 family protein [Loktanella sp. SALINAS62]MBS1304334.1 gluconate 2-dehydrogenase subunit 3 family protein [Loktanella sp. SALINAS62]